MKGYGDTHSRMVFWLKIILPLIALVILSTLFLFSRRIATEGTLPYAEIDVNRLAQEQRLGAPRYQSVTADGAAVSFQAATARPGDAEGPASASQAWLLYDTPGGMTVELTAPAAQFDDTAQRATLTGGVTVTTSTGYSVTSSGFDAALAQTRLRSRGPVAAQAPFGALDAGQMLLRQAGGEGPGYELDFTAGVKLIYRPSGKGLE
ncbi:hypothetical protein [Albidovulum sp.]